MAVPGTLTEIEYTGNGSTTTPYIIPFSFLDVAHITVAVVTGATDPPAPPEDIVWSVTRNGDGQGGAVTSSPAVTSASTVRITRNTPLTQPSVFQLAGPFPAKGVETSLDRLELQIQELARANAETQAALDEALERIEALEDGIVVVPLAPLNLTLPVITGQATTGNILSVSNGTWADTTLRPAPTGYAYQWCRDDVEISGATLATYTLVSADEGKTIAAKVTATNGAGSTIAIAAGVLAAAAPTSQPRYFGTSASTSLDEAGIEALTQSNGVTRAIAFTINGGGQYIYYSYPASFGDVTTLLLNGLNQIGAFTKTTVTVDLQTYNVYRSNNVQNGTSIPLIFV